MGVSACFLLVRLAAGGECKARLKGFFVYVYVHIQNLAKRINHIVSILHFMGEKRKAVLSVGQRLCKLSAGGCGLRRKGMWVNLVSLAE